MPNSPARENELALELATALHRLDQAKAAEDRWKREAADLSGKLSNMRQSAARSEAFRRVVFEQSCYGLVFHVLDRDTQGARPIPVVVPIGAFSEAEPKTWPVVVEHTCKAAVQAQRAVHFSPLDPDERTRLSAREAERTMVLEIVGADEKAVVHQAVNSCVDAFKAELAAAHADANEVGRDLEAAITELAKMKATAKLTRDAAKKHGAKKGKK